MDLLSNYLPKIDFDSYSDFKKNFKLNVPDNFNFGYDIVDEYARLSPEKTALIWCDDKGREKVFTFSDIKLYSDKAANAIQSLGIKKGDFVMLILNRRYEYWYLSIALNKIGAIMIPATHLLTSKDVEFRCNKASIKMVITNNEEEILHTISKARANCPTVDCFATLEDAKGFVNITKEMEKADSELKTDYKPCSTDPFLMYFTSGTTGMPKMVLHMHSYPLGHITTAKYWHNVNDQTVHFTLADTGWAKASWGKIYGQWIAGATQFVYDYYGKFTPLDLLPLIEKYNVTSFCAPPTVYRFLIKEDLSKFNLSSLKYVTTAGEPLNPEVFKQILEKIGLQVFEGFGQSESVVMLATFKYCECKPGAMGLPSPLYDIRLLDENNNEVSMGEEGEIAIYTGDKKICGLMTEYYLDKVNTDKVWKNGFYRTGDIAYKDENGYFWFVGRCDDIIKSSGYRIGPFEVESALLEHPSVLECAITAVPDELRGQIVKATVVLAKNFTASEELKKELQRHVKQTTAPYKYPRIIEFVEALPKTNTGKIRRVTIRNENQTN